MGRRFFTAALVAMLVFVATAGSASALDIVADGAKISATEANTATALGNTVTGVTIFNSGASEIFVAFNAVATTDGIEIPAGASVAFSDFTASVLGVICSAGETATVYVYWSIR